MWIDGRHADKTKAEASDVAVVDTSKTGVKNEDKYRSAPTSPGGSLIKIGTGSDYLFSLCNLARWLQTIGDLVASPYGPGIIMSVREDDMLAIAPQEWIVPENKPSIFYVRITSHFIHIHTVDQIQLEA